VTNPTDLAALARALDIARKNPKETARINGMLAEKGSDDWLELARAAAYSCQMEALKLPPWRSPPMFAHIEQPRKDESAAELLSRMLNAGLSRYESDPVGALKRAEEKKAKARGKAKARRRRNDFVE
jgi:hypothetical protein